MRKPSVKKPIDQTIEDAWEEFAASPLVNGIPGVRALSSWQFEWCQAVFYSGNAAMFELLQNAHGDGRFTDEDLGAFHKRLYDELIRFFDVSAVEIVGRMERARRAQGRGGAH